MDLINYLNENFYTKQQLLALSKISDAELLIYQQQKVMPTCSYKLAFNYASDSFFGEFINDSNIEYYAKGYLSWLGMLKVTEYPQDVYAIFAQRYKQSVTQLKSAGYYSADEKVNANLDLHIEEEWQHFLNGIYGLCTKSGLPEDIAAKELAILQINEILTSDKLSKNELSKLTKAVNLLDSASAMFAPHERLKSSRHRLVDEVRRQYQLTN
jgi:uncharacterized protein DUF6058